MVDAPPLSHACTRRTALMAGAGLAWAALAGPARGAELMREGHAATIARAVAALPEGAPPAVAERTAWTLADNMAAMIYAGTLPDAMAAAAYFAGGAGRGAVDVVTTRLAGAPAPAAAAMAYLLHAAEIDDTDPRGELRASAGVMPACLAAAQAADATGTDFIRAAALAYTLQGRFVAPTGPVQVRGWMASGVWAPPAAAAAAALLHKRPAGEIAASMALAGAAAGGVFQYYFDLTDEKRVIVARAARAAVESAELATLGEAGAERIFEGRAGLYALFAGAPAPEAKELAANLGALEGPLHLRPKFFAASHSIIPTLEGLQEALPADFDAGAVEAFVVRGDASWGEVIADKINDFEAPESRIGAALNFSFVVAMLLRGGSVLPGDYTDEALRDPAILALARKGRFETAPGEALSIELMLRGGETVRAAARDPGAAAPAPLDAARRLEKFEALTASRLDAPRRRALREHCMGVGEARSMRDWAARARSLCV